MLWSLSPVRLCKHFESDNQGKTIKSREDGLEEKIYNFRKQEEEVRNLDIAFRDYVNALETIKSAESNLMSAWASNIHDWENLENFQQNAEAIRERRSNNVETLQRDVIIPMMTYREQFSEIKRRLDKCEAKRIEFDRNSYKLHQLEAANDGASNSKAAVEAARMKVDKSHDAYNAIANDLSNLLPEVYDARRELYATNLQTLFSLQTFFHNDISYIFRDMSDYVLIKLKND